MKVVLDTNGNLSNITDFFKPCPNSSRMFCLYLRNRIRFRFDIDGAAMKYNFFQKYAPVFF